MKKISLFVFAFAIATLTFAQTDFNAEPKDGKIRITWKLTGDSHKIRLALKYAEGGSYALPIVYSDNQSGIKKDGDLYTFTDPASNLPGTHYYKLIVDGEDIETSYEILPVEPITIPATAYQTYEYPIPQGHILPEPEHIVLSIYDLTGRLVISKNIPYTSRPEVLKQAAEECKLAAGTYTYRADLPANYQKDWWTEHQNFSSAHLLALN